MWEAHLGSRTALNGAISAETYPSARATTLQPLGRAIKAGGHGFEAARAINLHTFAKRAHLGHNLSGAIRACEANGIRSSRLW